LMYTNKTGFERTRHILQQATSSPANNFTNLTVCYNESIGCAAWNFLNLSDATLDSSNFIAHPQFISLDDSAGGGAIEFNKSANLTIAVSWCSPTPGVIKKTGFPTTLAEILTGDPYATTATCSNNVLRFPVTAFSGYAANMTIGQCFYANNPDTVYNIAADLTGNKSDAICVTINASNILINCSGHSVTGNTSGTIYGIATYAIGNVENVTIADCTVSNYTRDISLQFANYSVVRNNTVHNATQYGIYLDNSYYSVVHNNTVYDTSLDGIRLRISNNSNVTNNRVYDHPECGIITDPGGPSGCSDIRFENNLVYNNTIGLCPFIVNKTVILNNTANGNSQIGMALWVSSNAIVENNTARNNGLIGFSIVIANNTNLTNNTISNNSQRGCQLWTSDNSRLAYMNYYNNGYDLFVNNSGASALSLALINNTFRNPSGTLANYTLLSLTDSVGAGEAYSINWTTNTSALPANYISFEEKFLNITTQNATPSIDAITWYWLPSELPGYDENLFVLAQYNASGWFYLNNTPDTVLHRMSVANLNPASDYGILQNNSPQCMIISSSGSYQLTNNTIGAPFNASEVTGIDWACVKIAADNVDFNCNGYNITNNGTINATGIVINGTAATGYSNVTIRNCPSVTEYKTAVYLSYADGNLVRNVTAHNNTENGFRVYGFPDNNVLVNNTAYNNTDYGFYVIGGLNNTITNSTAYDNVVAGIRFEGANNGSITNNLVYNGNWGIQIMSFSGYNNVSNNTVHDVSGLVYSAAIYNLGSHNNTICDNTLYDNRRGVFIWRAEDNYVCGGNIFRNINGIDVSAETATDASTEIVDVHLYNNTQDLYVRSDGTATYTVNATNATFDNPAGSFQNYTSISLNDTGSAAETYFIDWSAEPIAPPVGYPSFIQKYVNITPTGTPSVDLIRFNWLQAEVGTYNETLFEVWRYNGTWIKEPGQTIDTTDDYIQILNFQPSSVYGILQKNISECMIINSSGSYNLISAVVGAPFDASEVDNINRACIKIAASNVDFSCAGYPITNNGTVTATAVVINGSTSVDYTNVTIRDCPSISGYDFGAYIFRSTQDRIQNVTVHENSYGFYTRYGELSNITNSTARNNTWDGFFISFTNDSLFVNNSAFSNFVGFHLSDSSDNILRNNTAYDNFESFMIQVGSRDNLFDNNTAYNSSVGFDVWSATLNNFTDNTVRDNPGDGFYIREGANNTILINNTIYNNSWGVHITDNSLSVYITDNDVFNNQLGVRVDGSSDNAVLYDNNVTNNSQYGIQVYGSTNTNITGNIIYENNQHGIEILDAWYHTVQGNTVYDNTGRGIDFGNVTNSNVSDNRVYNNTDRGIQLRTYSGGPSIYNRFVNNTVFNHTLSGIVLVTNSNFNVFINNTLYNLGVCGFDIESSANSNLTGNNVSNTGDEAYLFLDSNNNRLLHNMGYNASDPGESLYFFLNSSNNYLLNNTANLAALNGFLFTNSTDNTLINNTAMFSGGCGFDTFWNSHRNYFENNTAYNHTYACFCGDNANHSLFINNTAYNAGYDAASLAGGFVFSNFVNYTFLDNVAYDNGAPGIIVGILAGAQYGLAAGDDIVMRNNIAFNTTGTSSSLFGIGIGNSNDVDIDNNNVSGGYFGIGVYGNINSSAIIGIPAPIRPCDNVNITNNFVDTTLAAISTLNATDVNISNNNVQTSVIGMLIHTTDLDIYNNTLNVSDPTGGAPVTIGMALVACMDGTIHENNVTTSPAPMGLAAMLVGVNNSDFYLNDMNGSGGGIFVMDIFNLAMFGFPPLPPQFPNLNFTGGSYGLDIYDNNIHDSIMMGALLNNYTGNAADPRGNTFANNNISNILTFGLILNETDNVDFDNAAFNGNIIDNTNIGLGLNFCDGITVMRSGITITNSGTTGLMANFIGLFPPPPIPPVSGPITVERINDATGDYGAYVGNISNLTLISDAANPNGRIHFPSLNITVPTLMNNAIFLLQENFTSLDSAVATDFNVSADIMLFTPACPVDVYTLAGFSQTRENITQNGTIYTPTYLNCAGNSADFGVTNFSGYALNVTPAPYIPPGGGQPAVCEDVYIELISITCPGNIVTYRVAGPSGSPISGAKVVIERESVWWWSDVGYSNSEGEVSFTLPAEDNYYAEVDGGYYEDYCSDSIELQYVLCPDDACYQDDDCADTEYCDITVPLYAVDVTYLDYVGFGVCMPVQCECGEVYDHRCHEYECCANADCSEGYVCENHQCVPRECESNDDCAQSEYCSDGECIPIPLGDCGFIANHSWYDYDCCNDSDCPEGQICYEHECILYRIETNETGYVGDDHGVQVYPEGPYTLTLTDPDGREFTVITDANGRAAFLLETEGKYGIELVEEGVPVITVDVQSLKRPLPPPDDKPVTILDELLKYFWWLLILLLLIIGYILFRRRKKKRYKVGT